MLLCTVAQLSRALFGFTHRVGYRHLVYIHHQLGPKQSPIMLRMNHFLLSRLHL